MSPSTLAAWLRTEADEIERHGLPEALPQDEVLTRLRLGHPVHGPDAQGIARLVAAQRLLLDWDRAEALVRAPAQARRN